MNDYYIYLYPSKFKYTNLEEDAKSIKGKPKILLKIELKKLKKLLLLIKLIMMLLKEIVNKKGCELNGKLYIFGTC